LKGSEPGAILLAAGQSRRFGADKRQVLLADNQTVLMQSIKQAALAFSEVLVVLRGNEAEFAETLQQAQTLDNVRFCLAEMSAAGMAHSLAAGISEARHWHSAAILLGDMPYLKPDTLQILISHYQNLPGHSILIPTYQQKPGHPVFFHQCYFEEIMALSGDEGAKSVIKSHPQAIVRLEVEDSGILRDIDTPADLA